MGAYYLLREDQILNTFAGRNVQEGKPFGETHRASGYFISMEHSNLGYVTIGQRVTCVQGQESGRKQGATDHLRDKFPATELTLSSIWCLFFLKIYLILYFQTTT